MERFDVPELLFRFAALESTPNFTISYLGIDRVHTEYHWFPYAMTPPDVLQFAWTGGDGIHFGFLTDFGKVTDLGKAPIVCVSPASDAAITLVARDLSDFLRALCLLKSGNSFSDLQRYARKKGDPWWTTFQLAPIDDRYEETLRTAEIVAQRLNLTPLPDYQTYLRDLWAERQRSISVETKDGLGILRTPRSSPAPEPTFDFEAEGNQDLDKMRAFIKQAGRDATLAFCKDAQYFHSFIPGRADAVRHLVADTLAGLGLDFESERIRNFGE